MISKCVFSLAPAYFSYLRWTVTVSYGRGDASPAGPAALSPHGPRTPAPIHALGPSAKRYTLPLITPLEDFAKKKRKISLEADKSYQGRKI